MSEMEVTERDDLPYVFENKFCLDKTVKNYSNQFNQMYNQRLTRMRDLIRIQVRKLWGDDITILDKIIDSETNETNTNKEFVIIGTLYKQMELRSSVLDEFKESNTFSSTTVKSNENFVSENDVIVLEDESGRMALSGVVGKFTHDLVTGVVVAVRGREQSLGCFESSDFLFLNGKDEIIYENDDLLRTYNADCLKNSTYENMGDAASSKSSFVMLVSDLQIGSSHDGNHDLSRQMLFDFISGRLGSADDRVIASRINRLIIAGNSVSLSSAVSTHTKERFSNSKQQLDTAAPMKNFDFLVSQALGNINIDIMPGKSDPSNVSLPQQPLNSCLFPHGSRFNSLHLVTNPYSFSVDGVSIMGHSGQPVEDIMRQTKSINKGIQSTDSCVNEGRHYAAVDAVTALRKTLVWGHLAPTAPDTLACHPYTDDDPFIVDTDHVPSILFSGCHKDFATSLHQLHPGKSTRLFAVPSFSLTKKAIIVDIKTLDYQVMSF